MPLSFEASHTLLSSTTIDPPRSMIRDTRFVAIAVMSPHFSWIDFMRSLRLVMRRFRCEGIRRIVRTFEAGVQIFWLGCSSYYIALLTRGVMYGRGFLSPIVEEVHPEVWCARNSWTKTFWSRKTGLVLGPDDHVHDSTESCGYCNGELPGGDFLSKADPDDQWLVQEALANQPRERERAYDITELYRRFRSTSPPEGLILPTRLRTTRRRGGRKGVPAGPMHNGRRSKSIPGVTGSASMQ